tara:strand:- start:13 stop:438 length:426 start_codon:yes stop_codon:yes gene_type:complete
MKNKDFYNLNISELIDLISNFQIKETKLNNQHFSKELNKASKDLEKLLKKKKIRVTSNIIRKIIFVSMTNLLVWESKDEMLLNKKKYYPILKKALQMNSIRNATTNSLMDDFKESDLTRNRVVKFTKTDPLWKKFLIKKLS